MTFSPEWETEWAKPENRYRRMSGNLSFLLGLFGPLTGRRILEFGCGIGSNTWPILQEGAQYYGIDGSPTAIQKALSFENTSEARFAVADFTKENPFTGEFDAVFDRASIIHNDLAGIQDAIKLIWDALYPGGLFFGCDWFSVKHTEAARGELVECNTRANYPSGQFLGIGKVHFTTEAELNELFADFDHIMMQERTQLYLGIGDFLKNPAKYYWVAQDFWGKEYVSCVYDFVVRKPE